MTIDDVLYGLSYANLVMLSATLPTYDSPKTGKNDGQEVINASDPQNRQRVKEFFNSID